MKNEIHCITLVEAEKLKSDFRKNNSWFIAEMDGQEIQDKEGFLKTVSSLFQFPWSVDNFDGYNDWIRDLDWLQKDGYVLFIYNFRKFLANDIQLKKFIIDRFNDTVLPWWEREVEECVVEGKAKPFNVYLID